MTKPPNNQICVYCTKQPATTWDHVLARSFFLVKRRGRLPKVPACSDCNGRKAEIESYLASVLPFGGRHADAAENLETKVPGRLAKNAKLHRRLASGKTRTRARTPSGVHVPSFGIPFDGAKFEALFPFVVRGLAWFHWGVLLDSDRCFVDVLTVTPHGERMFANFLHMNAKARVDGNLGDGTFTYRGIQGVDDPTISIWEFSFYGGATMTDGSDGSTHEMSKVGVMTGPAHVAYPAISRA